MGLAFKWNTRTMTADLVAGDTGLETDSGIESACVISLFTDQRASESDLEFDDGLDKGDLRGWWADQFAATEGDVVGSKLWQIMRLPSRPEVLERAQVFTEGALRWMLDDGIFSAIAVEVTFGRLNGNELLKIMIDGTRNTKQDAPFRRTWEVLTSAFQ